MFNPLKQLLENIQSIKDLEVIDFDNDGYLDLVLVGASKTEADRGVYLYHNKGDGSFDNLSQLLPEAAFGASQISTFDYNEDGDSDHIRLGAIAQAESDLRLSDDSALIEIPRSHLNF